MGAILSMFGHFCCSFPGNVEWPTGIALFKGRRTKMGGSYCLGTGSGRVFEILIFALLVVLTGLVTPVQGTGVKITASDGAAVLHRQ